MILVKVKDNGRVHGMNRVYRISLITAYRSNVSICNFKHIFHTRNKIHQLYRQHDDRKRKYAYLTLFQYYLLFTVVIEYFNRDEIDLGLLLIHVDYV